jgi:beta-1,4-N-acetylglucosaminyltransferase
LTYYHLNRGTYKPSTLTKLEGNLKVEVKDFIVLDTLIFNADLVISHCGAGILLECLRSDHATCIAVVNDTLMGNHQSELADQLSDEGYIRASTPKNVLEDIIKILGTGKA